MYLVLAAVSARSASTSRNDGSYMGKVTMDGG